MSTMRGRRVAAAALAGLMALAACSSDPAEPDARPSPDEAPDAPLTSPPPSDVTVLADDAPGELAIGASRALFDRAPVVVLAAEDDPAALAGAADRSATLGVPLLLTPPAGTAPGTEPSLDPTREPDGDAAGGGADPSAAPGAELARLETGTVVAFGAAARRWAGGLSGVEVVPESAPGPAVDPPEPLAGVTVLALAGEPARAAAATARAAGTRVLVTSVTDPRTDPDVITALAGQPPTHTLALGTAFGPAERLRERLAVAGTGIELPGGGQVVYPGRRIVALYGHPGDPGLGALGEQTRTRTIERVQAVAAEYEALVDEPVVPALEIITTIASASPGPAGDYSRRTPVADLREWVDAAAEAGVYVVLDLQPGHTDFLTQAEEYAELLAEPHVGLALDPEWRLAAGQQHMVNIGSVSATEVNQVVDWLADLSTRHHLPQKLLIVHQFQIRMVGDRDAIDTTRDQVAVLIHADGFGTPGQKLATWEALRADPLPGGWWGWKNFYDEDDPMLTPVETVGVAPSPVFISYQ